MKTETVTHEETVVSGKGPDRRPLAFHEAGHAVVAWALGVPNKVVSIRPGLGHAGVTSHDPVGPRTDFDLRPWWESPDTARSVGRHVAICLAGAAAEALFVQYETAVPIPDPSSIQGDRDAVDRLAPDARTRLLATEAEAGPRTDLDSAWIVAEGLAGSQEEVCAFMALMWASTYRLVNENADRIAALARALLVTSSLDGQSVDRIIAEVGR